MDIHRGALDETVRNKKKTVVGEHRDKHSIALDLAMLDGNAQVHEQD